MCLEQGGKCVSEYQYTGPRIPRNAVTVAQVRRRAYTLIAEITDRKYRAAVAMWAVSNDGPYPDRQALGREAEREVELLCFGLDGWGAVDPIDVLGPRHLPADFPDGMQW